MIAGPWGLTKLWSMLNKPIKKKRISGQAGRRGVRASWRVALLGFGFVLSIALARPAFAAAGDLDSTFGTGGKVTTEFTSKNDVAFDVAVQSSDGKIVAAGRAGGSGNRFALARYNTDGTLDTTFSGDGKVTTDFTSGSDAAIGVAIQPSDGKIVAAGYAASGGSRFALARYNTDGTLDTTFSGDGEVTTDFTSGDDFAWTMAIQADGKIVAAGGAGGKGERFALARYNTDGTLDTTFSGDGKVTTDFTSGYEYIDAIAIQPSDGKIVAVGSANYYGSHPKFALARYNTDGTLDTTFSGDGKVTTAFGSAQSWGFATAIQSTDGKIVAGGQAGSRFALARYNTNGALDTSFGGDGMVTTNFTPGVDDLDDIAIQGDGRIVAAGSANYFGPDSKFALARYNSNGTLDTSFGGDGKVTTNFTSGNDRATGVLLQPADGNIVVAGGAGGAFGLVRYLAT
jgi:uncharacterized delta-60 repeat protein